MITPSKITNLQYLTGDWEGTFTIRRPIAWSWEEGNGWTSAFSWHYFCPTCGEVWAKALLGELTPGAPSAHVPVSQPCRHHPTTKWHVAGSLLCRYTGNGMCHDPLLLDALPEALLWREFRLHQKHLERYKLND